MRKRSALALFSIFLVCVTLLAQAPAKKAPAAKPQKKEVSVPTLTEPPGLYAVLETSMGQIVVKLFEKEAPKTVKNFVALANLSRAQLKQLQMQFHGRALRDEVWKTAKLESSARTGPGFYDGLIFHRVIPKFMIQGGDPLGNGTGDAGYKFEDEFSPGLKFDQPGRLAMANSGPGTNGSQFFITEVPTPWLDNHYTIFGQVVEGQEVVNKMAHAPRDSDDKPLTPIKIEQAIIVRVGESATK